MKGLSVTLPPLDPLSLLEATPDAVVMTDLDGTIVLLNTQAERLFGYSRSGLLGRPLDLLLPERFRDPHLFEHPIPQDFSVLHADGTELPAELAFRHFRTAGSSVLVYSIVRDVSLRRREQQRIGALNHSLEERNAELSTVNRDLEGFTYSVAHDLRGPLHQIQGFTQILSDDLAQTAPPAVRESLHDILDSVKSMADMLGSLLDLSRLGARSLNVEVTALGSLVAEVLDSPVLRQETAARDIDWRVSELPYADCDATLLKRVYHNLLSNAVKYTAPRHPAVIEVGHTLLQGCSTLYVRDNGVGFNMKYASKLFGVFQRLHRRQDFEGTGVGLATVQRIVQKHGGRIWAEAELDRGATFYFTLAALQSESLAATLSRAAPGCVPLAAHA